MTKNTECTEPKNLPHNELEEAIQKEGEKFQDYYQWLEQTMPRAFFEEVSHENLMLITHSLIGFELQDYFSIINRKNAAIVLCIDTPDADLRILRQFSSYGIKNYEAHVSKEPLLFSTTQQHLRIASIEFTEAIEKNEKPISPETKQLIRSISQKEDATISEAEFENALKKLNTRFIHSLPPERLALAINLCAKAEAKDSCQCEVRYEENWQEKGTASMYVVLAWRNTPKHNFLYRLARIVHRHGLSVKRVNATYVDPYSKQSILIMALSLHGTHNEAAWEVANIQDFLREIVTVKYFQDEDAIDQELVKPGLVSGNMGNLLRTLVNFIHQGLVHIDSNLYTVENIEEALCRHPELTQQLCKAFTCRFDPERADLNQFNQIREQFIADLAQLDTGQETNDTRRKNVLLLGMNFIKYTLKTNFFLPNYTALSFRLDPQYLDQIPFDREKKFPDLPYAIFYIRGLHFFGFHIRFKDLARGGLRTVYLEHEEQALVERNHVFSECYNLAWTQHKKNKDIPEGGAKGVIFLYPFSKIDSESPILKKELEWLRIDPLEIDHRVTTYRKEQQTELLYQSQRAFIDSFMSIINCDDKGKLRDPLVLDYWKRPEYIYLGPDENMHDFMIEWIANFSKRHHYKPGGSFISSKPGAGINHKEYGVTSLGVNVYMNQVLEYMGIDPTKEIFTIKMSGGPDGDVAGNQLLNLYRYYPKTAKLIALTDGTGTIRDDAGLDLAILKALFEAGQGICHYPPEKLSAGGFLVHKGLKRHPTPYTQETLCWRNTNGKIVEDWLSGSDTNHLLRFNVHQTKADVFIPAGGRPRTLNEKNIEEFLDETGKPTAKAIIEGANLYLTPHARRILEEKGTWVIKDSSANKGGVICSSFEVLAGLTLDDSTFLEYKESLVSEILDRIKQCALFEADLLLKTHQDTGEFLTAISEKISDRINLYTYQILDYLDSITISNNPEDPMIRTFLNYCLPTLRNQFQNELLAEIPEHHKKAVIACHLASQLVYKRGLNWSPSVVDILPLILSNK